MTQTPLTEQKLTEQKLLDLIARLSTEHASRAAHAPGPSPDLQDPQRSQGFFHPYTQLQPQTPFLPKAHPQNIEPSTNALDILFKGLVLACATGIGWMTISLPVMKDNLDDLKIAVGKIEEKTENGFSQTDFLHERDILNDAIERNSQAILGHRQSLKEHLEFRSETRSELRTLKKHHDKD